MESQFSVSDDFGAMSVVPGVKVGVRVVLIDNFPDRRQLVAQLVEQDGDMSVVGFAGGPVSALDVVAGLHADAAVVEIQLPIAQGLDTISVLRDEFPGLAIVVCSFHGDAATKRAASVRGADSYLVKPTSARDLHGGLRSALRSRPGRDLS